MKKLIVLAFALAVMASACVDGERARLASFGKEFQVTCFSGGRPIYDQRTTGKVSVNEGGDMYFTEKRTGEYVRIHADCITTVVH